MTRVIVVTAALAALACAGVAAGVGRPTLTGSIVVSGTDAPYADDVMLVRADGTTLDLSNSPGPDLAPVVSPDGTRVAFYSTRSGHGADYVVGLDGKGLRQVTPSLAAPPAGVGWAPNGRDLAVLEQTTVYRASAAGGVWKLIGRGANGFAGWSPDGSRVAFSTTLDYVVAVSPSGKRLFRVDGMNGTDPLWSPDGRLAAEVTATTWAVYSENGKRLATVPASEAAWSADDRLATLDGRGVLAIRPGGTGKPTVTARPMRGAGDIRWAGPKHLLVRGTGGAVLFDVVHRKTFLAPAAYRLRPALSPDGSAFGESGLSLLHATLSGSTRTLVTLSACGGRDADPFAYLQALPDGSGAVYQSQCVPPHDLFSLAPDGSGLRRVTQTPQDELDPAVSPDGTHLAFTREDTGGCAGCTRQLWVTDADAGGGHAVPFPANPHNAIEQDYTPSFSPDGRSIVFARWDSGDTASLAEVPAAGGPVTTLKEKGMAPAWGPRRIAYQEGGVSTIAPNGTGRQLVSKVDGVPAWSADGRLAVLGGGDRLGITLPATGATISLPGLRSPISAASGLAWSPDGKRLAFTAADADDVSDVWLVNADGTGLTRITHGLGADGGLAWR